MTRPVKQVDVFSDTPYLGNPVAVVLGADGLEGEAMQRFARWTNLSETTFLLEPESPEADYRVRIFTPSQELPFAGHPTLGSCHAWLEARGGEPPETVVQECGAGLIPIRRTEAGLAFAAPPLLRGGPVDDETLDRVAAVLGVAREGIVDAEWADNGPGWVAALLADADAVLAVRPSYDELDVGVVGLHPDGTPELRAFCPKGGMMDEDPVTGSLNAAVAQWLLRTGRARAPYVARQNTGRVHVSQDGNGTVWVGGGTVTCVDGEVAL